MAEVKNFNDVNKFGVVPKANQLGAGQILGLSRRTVEEAISDTENLIPFINNYLRAQAEMLRMPAPDLPQANSGSISTSRFALLYHEQPTLDEREVSLEAREEKAKTPEQEVERSAEKETPKRK